MARVYMNDYIDPNAGLDQSMSIYNNPYISLQNIPQQQQAQQGGLGNTLGKVGGMYLAGKTAGIGSGAAAATPALEGVQSLASGGVGMANPAVTEAVANMSTPTDITNFAGSATPYLGAAGTALGAYSALQGIKKKNPLQAALGGAGAGLGINAMGYALGPWGWAAMAGVPLIAALGGSIFDKPSTRDIARKHTKSLMGTSPEDKTWQDYVSGMRKQYDSAPPDPSKPFAGKYGSWDEYKTKGLEAGDLTGVYGNLKAFGPDWAKKSFDQRKAITQKIIDAGLYDSKKCEVIITDENKAKEIAKGITAPPPKRSNGRK